jgi:hypothetical protein
MAREERVVTRTAGSEVDKDPVPDLAEDNAFFPSPHALSQYTAPKTDLEGDSYPGAYNGGKVHVHSAAPHWRRYQPISPHSRRIHAVFTRVHLVFNRSSDIDMHPDNSLPTYVRLGM